MVVFAQIVEQAADKVANKYGKHRNPAYIQEAKVLNANFYLAQEICSTIL